MRTFTIANPGNFTPTTEQQDSIELRQEEIREYCKGFYQTTTFRMFATSGNLRSLGGVLYSWPLMMAKHAMIDNGWNVLHHWPWFRVNLEVGPERLMWEMFEGLWIPLGPRLSHRLYIPDFDGTLLSGGLWTPVDVRERIGNDTFHSANIAVSDQEAMFWCRQIGGKLHHEQHPHGTLINLPMNITVTAGGGDNAAPYAVFGKPPYALSLGVPYPTWASVDHTNYLIWMRPGSNVTPGEYTILAVVTDANGEAETATWTVTVEAP